MCIQFKYAIYALLNISNGHFEHAPFKCRVMDSLEGGQTDTRSFTQSELMHFLILHPITSLLSIWSHLRTCGLAVCAEVSAPVFTEQTSLWTVLRLTCPAHLVHEAVWCVDREIDVFNCDTLRGNGSGG